MAKKVSATVEVEKVDTSANTITVKGPMGESDTIKVTDPAMQSQLANIKPGDKIQASYAQAIAVKVTPSSKQQSSMEKSPSGQEPPSGQQSHR
jgi:Cu/Ag efflux protein CusF